MYSTIDRLNEINENALINQIAHALPRTQNLINQTHESDSEILDIGLPSQYLAVTTDKVEEEIKAGLYTDPYFMGWMAVVTNLSDLAAVGAQPIGLLLSITIPKDWCEPATQEVIRGMAEAMQAHACSSLGGDLSTGEAAFGATAIGLVEKTQVMMRTGIRNGDVVYLTGPVGLGSAYALAKFAAPAAIDRIPYQPRARILEAHVISQYATACMDTSDGLISTIDQLCRLNAYAVHLNDIASIVHPAVAELGRSLNIPPLAILSAIHGEHELCFTIPDEKEAQFITDMAAHGYHPLKAGLVSPGEGIFINGKCLKSGEIRNLWGRSLSPLAYIQDLMALIADFV